MALFSLGKRNKNDGERKSSRGETSDDKPKRGRKKKPEPAKPWGKMERVILLLIIISSIGVSVALSLNARAWKLPGLPRIKIPKFDVPFLTEETIVIEGNKEDQERVGRAKELFKDATDDLSGVYGLYVIRLGNGSSYGVNENEVFEAASLVKLPVMVGVYVEFEQGRLDLDEKYTLNESDRRSGSGSLYGKPVGYTLTYRDLVRLMGKQSDNTAYTVSKNLLGDEKIETVMNRMGMVETDLESNETTPSDIGSFFEQLWRGNIVNETSRDEILEFLTDTIYEGHLAAGIDDDIRVAHKYGREVHVVNDAGIVFTEQPFVMVIMSKGVVESEADEVIPEISGMVYEIEVE